MMREVLERRFARLETEDPDRRSGGWPDLVLIDGGRGQLNAVCETLEEMGVHDVAAIGVAKGPDRNAGRSEEHTSELQSLMRISYAVFCLKKKNKDRQDGQSQIC